MSIETPEIIIAPVKSTCADHAIKEAQQALDHAKSIVIKDQIGYEEAAIALKQIKARASTLEDERTKITKPMDAAKKAVMELFKKPADFLAEAEKLIKRSMLTYSEEQERIRQVEQARLDEMARKEAEKLTAKAAKAEASGKVEKAEALRGQAQTTVAPIAQPAIQKVKGIVEKIVWEFEIVDEQAIPREWLVADLKAIGGAIRSTQGKVNIPGVKAVPRKTLAA